MKYTVALAALFALVSAQSKDDIPSCARSCLDDAAKSAGCDKDDLACVCQKVDTVQVQAAPCVIKECGQDVALKEVAPAALALCKKINDGGAMSTPAAQSSMPPQQSAQPSQKTDMGKPVSTDCVTTMIAQPTRPGNNTQPTGMPPVTGGASGVSVGLVAMLAMGALAL